MWQHSPFLAVAISLAFYPLVRSVYLGQLQTWIDLLFAALVWAWLADRKEVSRGADATDLMIAALTFTLAAPVVWEHHYGIALPIFA